MTISSGSSDEADELPRGGSFTLSADGLPSATNPYSNGTLQRAFHMPSTCQVDAHPSQEWEASQSSTTSTSTRWRAASRRFPSCPTSPLRATRPRRSPAPPPDRGRSRWRRPHRGRRRRSGSRSNAYASTGACEAAGSSSRPIAGRCPNSSSSSTTASGASRAPGWRTCQHDRSGSAPGAPPGSAAWAL